MTNLVEEYIKKNCINPGGDCKEIIKCSTKEGKVKKRKSKKSIKRKRSRKSRKSKKSKKDS